MNEPNVDKTIILAGATGQLGTQIAKYLIQSGAKVKALRRVGSKSTIAITGVELIDVDFNNKAELIKACSGGSCVVSALSGLRDVIVDTQARLLDAAIEAKVARFIPSDFSIDYTKLPVGSNRNLDLRREFKELVDNAPIAATTIFNGMFTDLLTGQAPIILKSIKRIMYWGNAAQPLDFTTVDNTAAYTALAALDDTTPRYLHIAGEIATIKDLQQTAEKAYKTNFKLLRLGGLGAFKKMISFTRFVAPQKNEIFPAWQGMQYMLNMFSGLSHPIKLDNHRYKNIEWTSIKDVLISNK